ncbi:MAG: hemerythrin domain-containing protein [Polyangiaceae bacterium]
MNVTEVLMQQHSVMRDLFRQLDESRGVAAKAQVLQTLATNMVGHDAVERHIFYPACELRITDKRHLNVALVEHGLIEFCLYQAVQAISSKDCEASDFESKCAVLKQVTERHMADEELHLFADFAKVAEPDLQERMVREVRELFREAILGDFQIALRANLQQVLVGIVRTSQ